MPHFASPWFLLLLATLPPLAWWLLRRRELALPHPSLALFAPASRRPLGRHAGLAPRLLGLACLALALAQPRWPDLRTRIDTDGIAVLLVVDVSGSMAERDFPWGGENLSRLDAVKRVFRLFVAGGEETLPDGQDVRLDGRHGDLCGLVTFGTRPEVTCPLTLSHPTLLRLLDEQQPRDVGEAETNVSDAVALGLARLKSAGPRRKVVVLLTDGEHNVAQPRSSWTPKQTAQLSRSLGVPIHAIDAGNDAPSDADAEARERAVEAMKSIASISGGRYFAARDGPALVAACREIDALERTKIASFQYRRHHEGYPWLAAAAFALFAASLALERTLWRRLP